MYAGDPSLLLLQRISVPEGQKLFPGRKAELHKGRHIDLIAQGKIPLLQPRKGFLWASVGSSPIKTGAVQPCAVSVILPDDGALRMLSKLLHPVAHSFINMKRIHGTAEADFIQINGRLRLSAAGQTDFPPGSCPPVFPLHKAPLIGDIDFLPPCVIQAVFELQRRLSIFPKGKNEACLRRAFAVYKAVESEQMLQNAFFFPETAAPPEAAASPEAAVPQVAAASPEAAASQAAGTS